MNLTEEQQKQDNVPGYVCERCHTRHDDPDYDDIHVFGQVYMVYCTLYYLCTACSSGLAEIAESYICGHPITVANEDGSGYTWRWPEAVNG